MCSAFFCGLIIWLLTVLGQLYQGCQRSLVVLPLSFWLFFFLITAYIPFWLVGCFYIFLKMLTVKMKTEENSKIIEKLRLEGTSGDQLVQP